MTENEAAKPYYWTSEIQGLLDTTTPSISSFYRRVAEGQIPKFEVEGQSEVAYDGPAVRSFLRGELSARRGKKSVQVQMRKESAVQEIRQAPDSQRRETPASSPSSTAIDVARPEDLYSIYGLEIAQLGFLDAIAPNISYPWLSRNDHIYWFLHNTENRGDISAMLSALPVREELIQRLLRKEITPLQISPRDILPYTAGGNYTIYLTSAATRPERKEDILPLMERFVSYWCEQSITITAIFTSVESSEDTPLLRIVTQCYFVPLNEDADQWRLRPFARAFQVPFIKNYQQCIQEKTKETPSMLVLDHNHTRSLDDLRQIYQRSLKRKGSADFAEKVHELVEVDVNGFVTRRDGNNERRVWVGRIRNDDDIRATLRINASLFGPSKKYSEDQLVEFRRTWLEKNPDIYRVLEIDGEVVGFIFAMPLPLQVIQRILLSEIKVGDISIEDLLEYKPGQPPVDVYLQTLGLHKKIQGGEKIFAGSYLIAGMERLITDVGESGVEVGAIYTRSDESDGLKMIGALGFDELAELSEQVGKLVFRLDFSQEKPSLRAYKQALQSYQDQHQSQGTV